jgi:hypothetical protein
MNKFNAPIVVYDLEIKRPIMPRDPSEMIAGLSYATSWGDYAGMGFSILVACWLDQHYTPVQFEVYDEKRLSEIPKDFGTASIVGFNSKGFDDKVLGFHGVNVWTDYDLLQEVRIASGQPPNFTKGKTVSGYNVDSIARANGFEKTGNGGHYAPMMYQHGKHAELTSYCLNDVLITANILRLGVTGDLTDPVTGAKLTLNPVPPRQTL